MREPSQSQVSNVREYAQHLLAQLPPGQLPSVIRLLEFLLTDGGNATVTVLSHEALLAQCGLTSEDWDKLCGQSS